MELAEQRQLDLGQGLDRFLGQARSSKELLDYGDGYGDVQHHEPGAGDRFHGEASSAIRLGQDVEQVVPGPLQDRGQGHVDLRAHEGGHVGGEQPAKVLGQQGEHLLVFFFQRAGRPHPQPPQRLR